MTNKRLKPPRPKIMMHYTEKQIWNEPNQVESKNKNKNK